MLERADIKTITRSDTGACGPSSNFDDPTNDPKDAAKWDRQREIRAELIRWLFVDPDAVKQVDPTGIRALGARLTGNLDLSSIRAPFGLILRRCAIPESMNLAGAELQFLRLSGSHTGEIDAGGVHVVRGLVWMDSGFRASGQVDFGGSRIDGDFNCNGGSFTHNKAEGKQVWDADRRALLLWDSQIQGRVYLSGGFQADGLVDLSGATLVSLFCFGGRFINPGRVALNAYGANVSSTVSLGGTKDWPAMESNGLANFDFAKVGGVFYAIGARFLGKSSEPHGLSAAGMSAGGGFWWLNVELQNGATLDLRSAAVRGLVDDEKSWPQPGSLAIDGFTYGDFYAGPSDARSRLRWVGLGSGSHPIWLVVPSGFHPQPYRELARVLRNRGDEAGALEVLVAQEDARYLRFGLLGKIEGAILKITIGYGHRPLLTVMWSLAVIIIGWGLVWMGKRAQLMRPTWPENAPEPAPESYEELHPLLYSIDAFFPFVNLHQEHYWWPDSHACGDCPILGRSFRLSGRALRYYLWFQIGAGWLLSAIFVAGVTGLIRSD